MVHLVTHRCLKGLEALRREAGFQRVRSESTGGHGQPGRHGTEEEKEARHAVESVVEKEPSLKRGWRQLFRRTVKGYSSPSSLSV